MDNREVVKDARIVDIDHSKQLAFARSFKLIWFCSQYKWNTRSEERIFSLLRLSDYVFKPQQVTVCILSTMFYVIIYM